MLTHFLCGSGTTQSTDDSARLYGVDGMTGQKPADYGHCATALLGIAALGFLLAFPTWLF